MTNRRDVPEPWATALVRAGVTDPRNEKRPSMNQLAIATGVHTSTITSMVWGERETDQATLDKVAEVLRVKASVVAEWAGRVRSEETPYQPPAVANLMTQDQRNLVDGIIRQFTAHAKGEVEKPPLAVDMSQAAKVRGPKQIQRQLERARKTREDLIREGGPEAAPAIAALNDTIRRLEVELSEPSQQGRSAHTG